MRSRILFVFCLSLHSFFLSAQQEIQDYDLATLDSIMNAYAQKRAFQKLEPYATIALEKAAQQYGQQDTTYARMLYFMGIVWHTKQNLPKALELYHQALAIQKKQQPQSIAYLETINRIGTLHFHKGDYEAAETSFKQKMELSKQIYGEKHLQYAASLHNLGILYRNMRVYEAAENACKEAIQIRKEILGTEHQEYAASLANLGSLYYFLTRYQEAEKLLLRALAIYNKTVGKKSRYYIVSANNLAGVYSDMKRYPQAVPLYKEVTALSKELYSTQHPFYASCMNNLARVYYNMGAYQEAEPIYLEAVALRQQLLGTRHFLYLQSLNNLLDLYNHMDNYPKAWDYAQQVIRANSGTSISTNITTAWKNSLANSRYQSIYYMAISLRYVYDLLEREQPKNYKQQQILVADLAMTLLKRRRNEFIGVSDKLMVLAHSTEWLLRSLSAIDPQTEVDKAFLFAEENKSALLMDATKAERSYTFGQLPDSLVAQEKALQKSYTQLNAALLESRPNSEKDSLRSALNTLNFSIQSFKENLNNNYPEYANLKYQNDSMTIQMVQENLDKQSALIEYVASDSILHIFYIDQQQVQLVQHPLPIKLLKRNIKDFHRILSHYQTVFKREPRSFNQYAILAHWFYKQLLAPVLKNNSNIKHLTIVTDGELGHLPFEAFLVEAPEQLDGQYKQIEDLQIYHQLPYLVKNYSISYEYSAALWKWHKSKTNQLNNGQVLAIAGNYQDSLQPSLLETRLPTHQRLRRTLNPLPAAQYEVEALSKEFQGSFYFKDKGSERMFKEEANNYSIIHLAMHGLLNSDSPILSSLAFTEDGDSLENNFLQAYEISKMQLNADLVVLSACETGYGKFQRGNGIASLARAFMYAGASSLVVSLWQVNDQVTAIIMQHFYRNLAEGMSKAEALRQAKLSYLEEVDGIWSHPAFWSPFIQMGNSTPIYIAPKRSYGIWLAPVIGIFVLFLLVFLFRRRAR